MTDSSTKIRYGLQGAGHYNYFRDYNPQIGRYIQSDPVGLAGGVNAYAYVNGQPLSSVDPEGLLLTGLHAFSRDMTTDDAVTAGAMGNAAAEEGGIGGAAVAAAGVAGLAGVRAGWMCYRVVEKNKDICNNAVLAAILGASICGNMSGTVKGSARSYPRDRERIEDVGNATRQSPRRNTGTDPR